jgi:hypothetical protein
MEVVEEEEEEAVAEKCRASRDGGFCRVRAVPRQNVVPSARRPGKSWKSSTSALHPLHLRNQHHQLLDFRAQ